MQDLMQTGEKMMLGIVDQTLNRLVSPLSQIRGGSRLPHHIDASRLQ